MFKLILVMTSMLFSMQSFAGTYSLPELKGQIYNVSSNDLQGTTFEIKLICTWRDIFNNHECGKETFSAPIDSNNGFQLPAIKFKYNSGLHKARIWIQVYIRNSQYTKIWSLFNLVTDKSEENRFKNSYQQYEKISFMDLPGDTLHFSQKEDAEWNCRTGIEQIAFPYNAQINIVAYDSENKSVSLASPITALFKNGKDETVRLDRTLVFVGGDVTNSSRFTALEQIIQGEMTPSAVYHQKNISENSLSELWSNLNEISCKP